MSDLKENKPQSLVQEHLNENVKYITTDMVGRQFEVEVREDLMKAYHQMRSTVSKKRQKIQLAALYIPKEFQELRVCDVLKDLGSPESIEDFFSALTERSKSVAEEGTLTNPLTSLPPIPPSARAGFMTPMNSRTPVHGTHVHQSAFGVKGLPTVVKKQPRPARPGEPVYTFSATGSPVLIEILPTNPTPRDNAARVKVEDGNGKTIDVDLVFRGAPQDVRNKIVTDFRCWARSRSALQTRKLLPHRPITKKNASLGKK